MGDVFLAHDRFLDRHVAVKFIGRMNPDPALHTQVLQEARAAARIQHPNVVAIFRIGDLDDVPYIVSEFIRGQPLSRLPKPMPWQRVLELGIQLARGLEAAHRHGVLHLDIKPENAILSDDDEVKLVDFGLAEFVERSRRDDVVASKPLVVSELDAPTAPRVADQAPRDEGTGDGSKPVQPVYEATGPVPIQSAPEPDALDVTHTDFVSSSRSQDNPSASKKIWGTPRYMAPESWRAEPATRRSDVYSLGVVLYEMCAGKTPFAEVRVADLGAVLQSEEAPPLRSVRADVDARFAAIVDRCLQADPGARFASGGALRDALESLILGVASARIPEGNPYRGLRAFEAEHAGLFFGRRSETGSVLQRLRSDPMVIVAGDSGAGKSSLCRAGVLPLIEAGALGAEPAWHVARMIPGKHPVDALAQALCAALDLDRDEVDSALGDGRSGFGKLLRRRLGRDRALTLFVDQFEELCTVSDAAEAALACDVLDYFTARTRQLRLLATVRGDFLVQVGNLPGVGESVARALYLLHPMSPDKVREAIVDPARIKGVHFESDELVATLVDAATSSQGGLPLLQFALAELWDARVSDTAPITAAALEDIGGVAGALARHADRVVQSLPDRQRSAARRVLMALVSTAGTRARRNKHELGAEGDRDTAAALEALIEGRLVVARETAQGPLYELAHESLLSGWKSLRTWLDRHAQGREIKERLERAVAEWERLGGKREALYSASQLNEAKRLDQDLLASHEQAFLRASQRAIVRSRRIRRALFVGLPVLAVSIYVASQVQAMYELDQRVTGALSSAEQLHREADLTAERLRDTQRRAFQGFDAMERAEGERLWAEALQLYENADLQYQQIAQRLESALALDAGRGDIRDSLGDILYERAALAESMYQYRLRDELIARMTAMYDRDSSRTARWSAPGTLAIATNPAAEVEIARYRRADDESGMLVLGPARALGRTPVTDTAVAPGSYLLAFSAPGHAPVRYPIVVSRGQRADIAFDMPRAEDVPAGFVFIPEGPFRFGSAEAEMSRRDFLETAPLHEVQLESFLIARHETTFGEWLQFLDALPDAEREEFASSEGGKITIFKKVSEDSWQVQIPIAGALYTLRSGEELRYKARTGESGYDWSRLPVIGINFAEAERYAAWLRKSGRVPDARLCTEKEWEKAARGADGRPFPHGYNLLPNHANYDETHGKNPNRAGPGEVGSYARSMSPYGVFNMAGNVAEWATSSFVPDELVGRGGAYFLVKLNSRTENRTTLGPDIRLDELGVRICATFVMGRT